MVKGFITLHHRRPRPGTSVVWRGRCFLSHEALELLLQFRVGKPSQYDFMLPAGKRDARVCVSLWKSTMTVGLSSCLIHLDPSVSQCGAQKASLYDSLER